MPANDWERVPPFSEMDVWLHTAKAADIDRVHERAQIDADEAAAVAAHAAAKAAEMSIRNRIAAQKRRGGHKYYAAKRPWQAAGYARKAEWESAGKPGPLPPLSNEEE